MSRTITTGDNGLKQYWYNIAKYEIVNAMKNREILLLNPYTPSKVIRGIFIKSAMNLEFFMERFNFFENNFNIYVSCAKYSYIPNFTLNLSKRSSETSKWFKTEAKNQIYEYDFLIDLDMKNIENYSKMCSDYFFMLSFLDKEKIYFNTFPSGNNFQIVIPIEVSNNDIEELLISAKKFINAVKYMFRIRFADLKGIGVYNKVRKCEYSLVGDKVVLPLTKEYISKSKNPFPYNEVLLSNVLKTQLIKYRGLQFWNSEEKENKKENFIKLLKKYA